MDGHMTAREAILADLRTCIFMCRMHRRDAQARGDYGRMVLPAEELYREARRKHRAWRTGEYAWGFIG